MMVVEVLKAQLAGDAPDSEWLYNVEDGGMLLEFNKTLVSQFFNLAPSPRVRTDFLANYPPTGRPLNTELHKSIARMLAEMTDPPRSQNYHH